MDYIAHVNKETGKVQPLIEHLTNTAMRAGAFAASFGAETEAYRCGMLHDIGKYSDAFQQRIRNKNIRVDHSTAGAYTAYSEQDALSAFCIAGHHGGIPDCGARADCSETLHGRMNRAQNGGIENYLHYKDEVTLPARTPVPPSEKPPSLCHGFFHVHMLFSCLVDADWLDTEAVMSTTSKQRGGHCSLRELSDMLDSFVSKWWGAEKPLHVRRCEILAELMRRSDTDRAVYTLTVPTGGGKTVSSMAFALRHALKNEQRRIIYVIPYTSIIEQTQSVFEQIFGPENVVAHYANVEYETDENGQMSPTDRRRYLASENWDAPIILTTAVQFFESLLANKPSRCRKLHNIAGSVLIFDEAQMLPVSYLRPCVWAITELVRYYRCTAVLCTATQPSLNSLIREYMPDDARELCSNLEENHAFFRRVTYVCDGVLSDSEVAGRLCGHTQVLCVVNSRAEAQTLFSMLPPDGSFHLSTVMTACHRRAVLDQIRIRLRAGHACRVVSTSLIEAGVDIDFPCVYRAMAGLDSIIQAAGRCNREGKRDPAESIVHIFEAEAKPPRMLEQNIAASRRVIERYDDIASPEAIESYFRFLYYTLKSESALDEKGIMHLIEHDMAFKTVAQEFKLIESQTFTVYVPLEEGKTLTEELMRTGPTRALMRELGRHSVGVYENTFRSLSKVGALHMISENAAVLTSMEYYDAHTGLSLSPEGGNALLI